MIIVAFVLAREFICESSRNAQNALRAYAHMRRMMHMGINAAILAVEVTAIYMVHYPEVHAGITTAVFAHETVVYLFSEV
ncbi:hypothetical protein [Spirillospora sp. CA-128828]|uniref:hypothetical protein n=1 Tax=Spirillospora sp. CA-128828 TaxID=3240033 RepID=UPI003D8FBA4E